MSHQHPEMAGSKVHDTAQRPRDAATLILVRRDGGHEPRVLMGQRHHGHAFMPNKFVFPGGRLDPEDCAVKPWRDLHPLTLDKLTARTRLSMRRARGLAVAAVRETLEEAGFMVGRKAPDDAPDLSHLIFFARAITPPGRTRRFDSRFFVADAACVSNLDRPLHTGSGELLTLRWLTIGEARTLDLPLITTDVLARLKLHLDRGALPGPENPVSLQFQRGNRWREEIL